MAIVYPLYKASPIGGPAVEDVHIVIEQDVDEFDLGLEGHWSREHEKAWAQFYSDQAKGLVEALIKALPGGTIDALLVHLLDHKRSLFKIPFVRPEEDEAPYLLDLENPNWVERLDVDAEQPKDKGPEAIVMSFEDQQEAFDLLASLIEETNNAGYLEESPVKAAAEIFCNARRDEGFERTRFAEDYKLGDVD